jgi:hypothetical protein
VGFLLWFVVCLGCGFGWVVGCGGGVYCFFFVVCVVVIDGVGVGVLFCWFEGV